MKAQQVEDYYIVHECTRVSNQASSDSDRCEPSCDNFGSKPYGVGGWVAKPVCDDSRTTERKDEGEAARLRPHVCLLLVELL